MTASKKSILYATWTNPRRNSHKFSFALYHNGQVRVTAIRRRRKGTGTTNLKVKKTWKRHTLWKHPTSLYWSFDSLATSSVKSSMISRRHSIEIPIETFFDLVTLIFDLFTFKLNLNIHPLDRHTETQVFVSVRLATRVVTHQGHISS